MPRRPKLLPFLRVNAGGRLQYYRRIPPEHRHLFGGRASYTRVLDCDPSKPRSKQVRQAWSAANEEFEAQIAGTSAAIGAEPADITEQSPLSPRDAAGIAAEPLRKLVDSVESGQMSQEIRDQVTLAAYLAREALQSAVNTDQSVDISAVNRAIAEMFVGPELEQLHIRPDAEAMEVIRKRFYQYLQPTRRDLANRAVGNYKPSELKEITPELPKTQVTYDALIDQWLQDSGGLRDISGSGVTEKRLKLYQGLIREVIKIIGKHYPAELTIADARSFVGATNATSLAIRTKQNRINMIDNLFNVGVRYGLIDSNPFTGMRIKPPKNARHLGYRPFSKEELVEIITELASNPHQDRAMIAKTLLCTGARSSDISMLRHHDIKQTEAGVWYLDLKHEPLGPYPHPLKSAASDERCTPLHPWLIKQGFLECVSNDSEGYVFKDMGSSKLAKWFMKVLENIGIYESRVTTLHSFRGTLIDLMREARLPQDVRRAMTGHSSKDIQDKSYGEGLQRMPEVLFKEIKKVDLSWLDE